MKSIWTKNNKIKSFPSLERSIKTGVLVIGGGLSGILTAYQLHRQGIDCILIEAGRILNGVTANTTAKITAQHNLIYDKLIKSFGEEMAVQYADANTKAIEQYRQLVETQNIQCGFETIPAYLYATEDTKLLEKEYKAAISLGLKARLTDNTTLPFSVTSALAFEGQAQFDPLAFAGEIAKDLMIYEKTDALAISGHTVLTSGGKITTEQIIITAHFPWINIPGYYFMRMHQERSYVVALENAGTLDGSYLGIDGGKYSLRTCGSCILLGGAGHRTGDNHDGNKYGSLLKASQSLYPGSKLTARWSAQDCMTHDKVPYIGKFSKKWDNIYVATGFNKWGMTSSMAASMILADEIQGQKSPYQIFSPQRKNFLPSFKGFVCDSLQSSSGLIKQKIHIPAKKADHIKNGHGGIVIHHGKKVGIYKDRSGKIYTVTTKCPHLGCELTWNPDELSWDCPCHGSRFDYKGRLIDSPAQININIKE